MCAEPQRLVGGNQTLPQADPLSGFAAKGSPCTATVNQQKLATTTDNQLRVQSRNRFVDNPYVSAPGATDPIDLQSSAHKEICHKRFRRSNVTGPVRRSTARNPPVSQ